MLFVTLDHLKSCQELQSNTFQIQDISMKIVISEPNLMPFLSNCCNCQENKVLNGTGTSSSPQGFSVQRVSDLKIIHS